MTRDSIHSEELFLFTSSQFTFLINLDYQMRHMPEETEFSARKVRWVITKQSDGKPPMQRMVCTREGCELVSPYVALQYSLEDFTQQWKEIDASDPHILPAFRPLRIGAQLLSRHRRLFTDTTWTTDKNLIAAARMLDQWTVKKRSEGVVPSALQAHDYLQSLKRAGRGRS